MSPQPRQRNALINRNEPFLSSTDWWRTFVLETKVRCCSFDFWTRKIVQADARAGTHHCLDALKVKEHRRIAMASVDVCKVELPAGYKRELDSGSTICWKEGYVFFQAGLDHVRCSYMEQIRKTIFIAWYASFPSPMFLRSPKSVDGQHLSSRYFSHSDGGHAFPDPDFYNVFCSGCRSQQGLVVAGPPLGIRTGHAFRPSIRVELSKQTFSVHSFGWYRGANILSPGGAVCRYINVLERIYIYRKNIHENSSAAKRPHASRQLRQVLLHAVFRHQAYLLELQDAPAGCGTLYDILKCT